MAKNSGRHFTKQDFQMTNKHEKHVQHHFSSEKCKLKTQRDTTAG